MSIWIKCAKCKEDVLPMDAWAEFSEDPIIYCEECWHKKGVK